MIEKIKIFDHYIFLQSNPQVNKIIEIEKFENKNHYPHVMNVL